MTIKQYIKNIPIVGKGLSILHGKFAARGDFQGSAKYWDGRYAAGHTSGSGSYGRLASFKADFLNAFVQAEGIRTVVEFGCGDGHQLQLANYPHYIGLDVSDNAIRICREKFAGDTQKQFELYRPGDVAARPPGADLSLSLDVIYHLVENSVYETYMRDLFSSATKFVIVYASNVEGTQRRHERTREFTKWTDEHCREWKMFRRVPNTYPFDIKDPDNTSQSDFFLFRKIQNS